MLVRRPRPSLALLALGLAAGGLTSGCSVNRDSGTSNADASSSPSPTGTSTVTVTPAATPSATATASTPASGSASPGASATPAPSGGGVLLSVGQLPAVPGSPAWTQERTGPASTSPFGLCQKVDAVSIGAESATERSFSSGQDTAAHQVARFPDDRTAQRADQVFQAWRDSCRDRVRASAVRVSPLRAVSGTSADSAWQYTVTYEVGGDVHAQAFGLARAGSRLSLVRLDLSGQADDSAPIPADLMAPVVRAAAARLG